MFDASNRTFGRAVLAALAIAVVAATAVAPAAASAGADASTVQSDENTTDPAASSGDAATDGPDCEPGPREPNLRQVDVHTTDSVVRAGDPAEVSGTFRLSSASECPVRVALTLSVGNDVLVEGGQNIDSSTASLATGEFLVEGGSPEEVRTTVYGLQVGEEIVTADVEYWPVGHPEEVETQTHRIRIQVEEPSDAEELPGPDEGSSDGATATSRSAVDWLPTEDKLVGLVALSILFLGAIGYKGATAEVVAKFVNR